MAAHPSLGLEMGADPDQRMILEVAPDARQVGDRRDAEPGQLARRSEARTQQQRRRMDGAGRDHDLARFEANGRAIQPRPDRDRPASVELDAFDERLREHAQIRPQPCRVVEIGHRRGDPAAIDVVAREGEAAVARFGVGVVAIGHARVAERVAKRQREAAPILGKGPSDRNRPVGTMQVAREVHVAFEPAEIGHAIAPAPARGTQACPLVVIGGNPAQRHLTVDARPAAHHPRLLVARGRRARGDLRHRMVADGIAIDGQTGPVAARGEVIRQILFGDDRFGHFLGWRIGTRLKQAHPVPAARRQPVGKNATGRAAADNEVVEIIKAVHFALSAHRRCHRTYNVDIFSDNDILRATKLGREPC